MPSLPSTFKAVVINKPNDPFTIVDKPLQPPGAGELLVKVLACGVCFSDVAISQGEMGTHVFPLTPGHEIVGQVAQLGSGPAVERFQVGDRVGGPWHGGHDSTCRSCQRGLFQMCDAAAVNGYTRDGGFAEYVLLRAEATARVPADMDPAAVAPLLCAGVTVFNSIRKLHVEQGALVAVQGLGGLGHLAVQYASRMGYEVAVLSSGSAKADFARSLGAHHYINTSEQDPVSELRKLGGAAIVVQTAPNPSSVGPLVAALATEGRLLNLAPVGAVEFDTVTLVLKGAGVVGYPSGHALDSEEAIRFAKVHGVECMIEKYPFSDVQKAVDSLVAGKPRFRNVLVMQ